MRTLTLRLILAAAALSVGARLDAGNPLIPTVYSADPSAHVWPGDERLWIYSSHDQPNTNTHDTMISYHVFSTTDLVNWTDHGVVLHLKDVKWAISHMWAIDCVKRDGKYNLIYCAIEKETSMFRTGIAVSDRPEGPFKDTGYIQGVEWGQDPALFVDDDNTPYLYWGAGGRCRGVQLTADLRAVVPGTMVELTPQLHEVFEGPWVHKYKGKYYLSYPGLPKGQWPENMYYATADKPLGPFTSRGKYIPEFPGRAGTNHGSIIQYKGRWLAFHHSSWVSGGLSEVRNLMCDYLEYNEDGSIKPIIPTKEGVAAGNAKPGPSKVTVLLEAENGTAACGELGGTRVATERAGYSGSGYVTGFDKEHFYVTTMVQSAKARKVRLKVAYVAPEGDRMNKVMVNYQLVKDPAGPPDDYSKKYRFPKTTAWKELDLGIVELKEGDNTVKVYAADGGIEVDYIKLEQVDSN
jgi:hypothetical protein